MTQEIATTEYISTALKKFSVTDAAISDMKEKYMPLKINGVDDKKGYLEIKEARLTVKGQRIMVEKARKELTADALSFQRAINSEATRIKDALIPIESHLESQEEIYEAEKERIRKEKENASLALLSLRLNSLLEIGFSFTGEFYILNVIEGVPIIASPLLLKEMKPEEFDDFFSKALIAYEKNKLYEYEQNRIIEEQKKLQEIEKIRFANLEREIIEEDKRRAEEIRKTMQDEIEYTKKSLEAERVRLEAIAIQQEQEMNAIIEAQMKIEHQNFIKIKEEEKQLSEIENNSQKKYDSVDVQYEKQIVTNKGSYDPNSKITEIPYEYSDKEKLLDISLQIPFAIEMNSNINDLELSLSSNEAKNILINAHNMINDVSEFIISESNKL